jgi:hypothetical protein
VNLGNDYEEAYNVEIINQGSTTGDSLASIPSAISYLIESISDKWIVE